MLSLGFLRDYLKRTIYSKIGRQVFIYLGFFILVTLIVFSNFIGAQLDLKPGQISPRNIRSPHAAIITDEARTRELQEQAAQQVRKVYQEDRDALVEAEQNVSDFNQVNTIRDDEALSHDQKIEQLQVLATNIIDVCPGRLCTIGFGSLFG